MYIFLHLHAAIAMLHLDFKYPKWVKMLLWMAILTDNKIKYFATQIMVVL